MKIDSVILGPGLGYTICCELASSLVIQLIKRAKWLSKGHKLNGVT